MSRLQRLMPQALSLRVDFSDADMGFGNRGDRPASQSLGEVPNYYEAYRLTKLAGDSGKTMDYLFGIAKDLKSESNTIDNWSELIDGISEVVAVESN